MTAALIMRAQQGSAAIRLAHNHPSGIPEA
jgi:DNA repair protein RadC